jgi:hypothetical protein
VTVPTALPSALIAPLQAYLSNTVAGAVTTGANFQNLNISGKSGNVSASIAGGQGTVGLLDVTNTDTHGVITSGAPTNGINYTVNQFYNTLAVQAPGTETVMGNGDDGFLAVFSSISAVTFNSNGGSGTVAAGGQSDFVNVSGTVWTVTGAQVGADTINTSAANAAVSVFGTGNAQNNAVGADSTPSNVVGLAGSSAVVYSAGTNDLIETYAGSDTVSVFGSANVLVNGGADTVFATSGNGGVRAFFNLFGGTLDFINNSTTAATVSGDVPGASGGEVTAFGGAGGGQFIGGDAGNNSLVGGTGTVTLVGAGTNNYLEAAGYASTYSGENILSGGAGGAYMIADSTTGYNEFHGGTGTDTMVSYGSGAQVFYVGALGQELITGATTSGATNEYVFDQTPSQGGSDDITNFRLGTDHIDINLDASVNGVVTIQSYQSLGGAHSGSLIYLSDNTTIQLYGVNSSALNQSIIGGTHI